MQCAAVLYVWVLGVAICSKVIEAPAVNKCWGELEHDGHGHIGRSVVLVSFVGEKCYFKHPKDIDKTKNTRFYNCMTMDIQKISEGI